MNQDQIQDAIEDVKTWIGRSPASIDERHYESEALKAFDSLVAKIATLTTERDEARSELEDAQRQEIETIAAVINHRKLIDEQKQKIDFLTAELAALTSCPGKKGEG